MTAQILSVRLVTCRASARDGVSWMYRDSMIAKQDTELRNEQALLGERLPDATDSAPAEVHSQAPNSRAEARP